MKITQVLYRINLHRHYNDLWKNRRSVRKVTDLGIPKFITDKNIPVYDAVKFASERDPVELSKFFPPKDERRQPQWAYMINHKTRFLEGPLQAQILTNSITHTKLPPEYEEAFNAMSLGDDEVRWFDNQLRLNSLDSQQFKLPHRIDPERVWYRFPRDFGPGIGRQTLELLRTLNDFVRLHATKTSAAAYKPLVHELACQYLGPPKTSPDGSPGVNPYVYQGYASSAVTAPKPLAVLSSSSSSKEAGPTGHIPSIYPTFPEVDLSKTFDYEATTICPVAPINNKNDNTASTSLQTIFISHPWNDDQWKMTDKLARAILQTFTFAAAQTVGRLGEVSGDLQFADRFRLQTVYHDMENVGFIVFHLNTLTPASSGDQEGPIRNEIYHESAPLQQNGQINPRALKWLKVFYET